MTSPTPQSITIDDDRIDRLARSIYHATPRNRPYEQLAEPHKVYWRKRARAAATTLFAAAKSFNTTIDQMLGGSPTSHPTLDEATPAMIKAGVEFALNTSLGDDYGWPEYIADLYREMRKTASEVTPFRQPIATVPPVPATPSCEVPS